MSEFAALLRRYRQRADLSCNELARAVRVDPSYISRMERDERGVPSFAIVLALAEALRLGSAEGEDFILTAGYASPRMRAMLQRVPPLALERLLELTMQLMDSLDAERKELAHAG